MARASRSVPAEIFESDSKTVFLLTMPRTPRGLSEPFPGRLEKTKGLEIDVKHQMLPHDHDEFTNFQRDASRSG